MFLLFLMLLKRLLLMLYCLLLCSSKLTISQYWSQSSVLLSCQLNSCTFFPLLFTCQTTNSLQFGYSHYYIYTFYCDKLYTYHYHSPFNSISTKNSFLLALQNLNLLSICPSIYYRPVSQSASPTVHHTENREHLKSLRNNDHDHQQHITKIMMMI